MTNHEATIFSSVVNTVNTIIGSGLLVLPYTFRAESIILGSIVLLFAGLANGFGMILQGAAAQYMPKGQATFFSVCKITYPQLSLLFDFAIFLQCFGVDISYLVLTSDLLPLVYTFNDWTTASMKTFYLFSSLILIGPLCFLKRLDSLKYASVVALSAIVYIALLIYGNFFIAWSNNWENIPVEKIGEISWWKPEGVKPFLKTVGIIVLAYTCPNQFSIISELHNPTIKRISIIAYISLGITMLIFFTVAISGYLTFGNTLNGNILLMYENGFYTQLGRVLLVLMVALSYPLMFHPARISFNNVYHTLESKWFKVEEIIESELESTAIATELSPLVERIEQGLEDHTVPFPESRFYLSTLILLIASYSSAYYLNSFELILSIVGATGGVLICFVLPGFYGYKLINNSEYETKLFTNSPHDANNWIFKSTTIKYLSLLLIIWGVVIMCICLYSIIF